MEPKFLPVFSGWLRSLGEDVSSLAGGLEAADVPVYVRSASGEALEYLLRAAELIPEGLEDLGYLEVAFALRVLARRALGGESEGAPGAGETLARLGEEAARVDEFLGEDATAFMDLCRALAAASRDGRAAGALLEDEERRAAVLAAARGWVEAQRLPELSEGPEELVKLRSFFRTRLRRAS